MTKTNETQENKLKKKGPLEQLKERMRRSLQKY